MVTTGQRGTCRDRSLTGQRMAMVRVAPPCVVDRTVLTASIVGAHPHTWRRLCRAHAVAPPTGVESSRVTFSGATGSSTRWRMIMRSPEPHAPSAPEFDHEGDPELVYASDVQITADPGGLRLTFMRPRAAFHEGGHVVPSDDAPAEVIARVMLPPLAARRLLRLLPRRLDLQRALADEYDLATDVEAADDPFLAALAEAEFDDEPYTDEHRAAAQAGRLAFTRGEFATLDDVWRELVEEDGSSPAAIS
jgi:hypothetical protein